MHLVLSFGRLNHSTHTDIAKASRLRILSRQQRLSLKQGTGNRGWERGMGTGNGNGEWERGMGTGNGNGEWERGMGICGE